MAHSSEIDFRSLNGGRQHVRDNETHELLGVIEPGQWISETDNLGRDPEVNHTNAGDPVVNLSVATSERWTDKHSGERRERTAW